MQKSRGLVADYTTPKSCINFNLQTGKHANKRPVFACCGENLTAPTPSAPPPPLTSTLFNVCMTKLPPCGAPFRSMPRTFTDAKVPLRWSWFFLRKCLSYISAHTFPVRFSLLRATRLAGPRNSSPRNWPTTKPFHHVVLCLHLLRLIPMAGIICRIPRPRPSNYVLSTKLSTGGSMEPKRCIPD